MSAVANSEGRWELPAPVDAPSADRLRDWFGRISHIVGMHPAGWVLLLVALVALTVGAVARWGELTLMGAMSVVVLLIALLFTIGRPSYEVRLLLSDRAVVVGEPAGGRVDVRNAAQRRVLPSRLDLPVGRDQATLALPSLASGAVYGENFVVPTQKRGVVLVGPAQSVQGDPFALTGRETHWTQQQELFVHPRTVSLPGRQAGFVHDLEGHPSPQLSNSDMNFHALRPYVPGDDRRHVHWRSSARTGSLMVRQFEETRQSRVAIALDVAPSSYFNDDEFELAVSVAASLAVQSIREDNPRAVLTNRDTLPAVSVPRVLDELSRVELAGRGSFFELVDATRHREPNASVVMVITGSSIDMGRIRLACTSFDVDSRVIGLRIAAGKPLSIRSVANVSVIQLGELSELPRAMRGAMS